MSPILNIESDIQTSDGISSPEVSRGLLNAESAARYLSLSVSFIRKAVASNRIPFVRIGTRTLFRTCDLDAWVAQHFVATSEEVSVRAGQIAATIKLGRRS